MNLRIALTGGGTGGHAYPAISIATALRSAHPDCEILYIGGIGSIEERLAQAAGIPFKGLTTRKMRKALSFDSIPVMGALIAGLGGARKILHSFKPDIVIGAGGYASAAVLIAQAAAGGKTLIHEQNAVPGRTNLWLSRFASRICVTFEDSIRYFPAGKTVLTGLPIRAELLDLPDKRNACASLGIDPDLFTFLVYGGSQGALKFSHIIRDSLPALREMPIQVVHQTGERNYEEAESLRKSAGWGRYHVFPYFDDARPAFAAADIMLSRCGASSIAEMTAIGIPAILVPYPYAYANHQFHNGDYVARNGGGILVEESKLTSELFVETVKGLLSSPADLERMREASRKLGKPDAAARIAAIAAEIAGYREA